MNKGSDRLDWLRKIRQKIVKKCGDDPRAMGDYFRKIQQQYKSRTLEGIWKDKGFEKIRDLESEIIEVRKEIGNAVLRRKI